MNNINSQTFFTTFITPLYDDMRKWEQSFVTRDDERVIDTTSRSSSIFKQKILVDHPAELNVFFKMCMIEKIDKLELTLYKYAMCDYFAPHIDRKRSLLHEYTLLLLPPCVEGTSNYFTGGDLLIGNQRINCSEITNYTYVIFSIDTLHSLEEVMSGVRYVFKGSLNLQKQNSIVNKFVFKKPVFGIFSMSVNEHGNMNDMSYTTTILKNGDINSTIYANISTVLTNMISNTSDTNETPQSKPPNGIGHPEDYDDGYYKQPDHRRRLYLMNKERKRNGKSTLRD